MKQKLPSFGSWEFYSSLSLVEKDEYDFIKNKIDKVMVFVYVLCCFVFVSTMLNILFNKLAFKVFEFFDLFVGFSLLFSLNKKCQVFIKKVVESKGA